jgi:dynein light intermediate chain 1
VSLIYDRWVETKSLTEWTILDGASVFYTTIAQPKTFALLKKHVLHRLYTSPPALHPQPSSPTSTNMNIAQPTGKFPFPYRANQLDRDSIMIPAGWDTWGKIEALKEGFQCKQINEMWDAALEKERAKRGHRDGMKVDEGLVQDDDDPTIDQVWKDIIPDLHSDSSVST